jgi:hypothetical protein
VVESLPSKWEALSSNTRTEGGKKTTKQNNKMQLLAVCKKLTSLIKTQRLKVKGWEKDIISKWNPKATRSTYIHI